MKSRMFILSLQAVLHFYFQKEGPTRKLTITLAAAALALGAMAMSASAQNEHNGVASIHALKNATPIVKQAACNGRPAVAAAARAGSAPVRRAAAAAFPAGRPLSLSSPSAIAEIQ
jgi:hypothetical protein